MICGPVKHATGGGRASSAAAADGESSSIRVASCTAANSSRDGSGGGRVAGGDSDSRAAGSLAVGFEEEAPATHPQLQQQDSRAASPTRTASTSPSPILMMCDSPRSPGGPVRALSPLAMLDRIERSQARGGCAHDGSSHGRAIRTSANGIKEEAQDAQLQLHLQGSRAASPVGKTTTPPSPTLIISDSPRPPGGPLRALSPLALLDRIERSRSRSRSRPKSSASNHDRNDKRQSVDTGRTGRRGKGETGDNSEGVVHVVVKTSRSRGALTPDGGSDGQSGGRQAPMGKDDTKSNDKGCTPTEHVHSDGHSRDGTEFSHDVASSATAWLASFEQRFMPCFVAEVGARAKGAGVDGSRRAAAVSTTAASPGDCAGSNGRVGGPETKDGVLPAAISRVLHEVREQTCGDSTLLLLLLPGCFQCD